jgi:hypothetical protein
LTTSPVVASIRVNVPSLELATHTDPSPTANPVGALPTGIVCTTRSTAGSIRETALP